MHWINLLGAVASLWCFVVAAQNGRAAKPLSELRGAYISAALGWFASVCGYLVLSLPNL